MKKLVALLIIVAVAMPAMATTTVTCSTSGTIVSVKYNYDGTGVFPRAFALDITTSQGTIGAVTATKTGESTSASKGFGIFPSNIQIDSTGAITSPGSPVSPQSKLPSGTLGGAQGMTVELGSLYADASGKPANSGNLLTFPVTGVTTSATITLNANTARGGVVGEDATTLAVTFPSTCTVSGGCACKGDVDGTGKVNATDLSAIVSKLNTYGGSKKQVSSSNSNYLLCGDVDPYPTNNGRLDATDVSKITSWLNTYGGSKKVINCPHTYN